MKIEANIFQKRFWLEWVLDKSNPKYSTPLLFEVSGPLDESLLKSALDYFVNTIDIGCRSYFQEEDGILFQHIASNIKVEILSQTLKISDNLNSLEPYIHIPFDLSAGPLFKFFLFKNVDDTEKKILLLNFHHIISDSKTASLFIQVIEKLYQNLSIKAPTRIELPSLPAYRDDSQPYHVDPEQTLYWCEKLSQYTLNIPLPTQCNLSLNYEPCYFTLEANISESINRFCRSQKCTTFILLSAVMSLVLAIYSQQQKIVITYPVDSRKKSDKNSIGCFINNYPLCFELSESKTFQNVIAETKKHRSETKHHLNSTLSEVLKTLRLSRRVDISPFNVSIAEAFFDLPVISLDKKDIKLFPLRCHTLATNDLSLAYQKKPNKIECRLEFDNKKFSFDFIQNFGQLFKTILRIVLEAPHKSCKAIQNLSVKELSNSALLPHAPVENKNSVLNEIAAHVKIIPHSAAIQCANGESLTYLELDKKSSEIACYLNETFPNAIQVVILMEKCIDLITAMVAVLKSGKSYTPYHPREIHSLDNVVIDKKSLILTHTKNKALLKTQKNPIIFFNQLTRSEASITPLNQPNLNDLAYILFTSGSTGKPKGVMVEHRQLINVLLDFKSRLKITHQDSVLAASTHTFDIFGLEIFLPLISGGTISLLKDSDIDDIGKLPQKLLKLKPTVIQGTPSFWKILSHVKFEGDKENLKVLTGGEALTKSIAQYLLDISKFSYQVYGPTETTIWSSVFQFNRSDEFNIIGKPIQNTQFLVKDRYGNLVPRYVQGELYISGGGVSRGYISDPTQSKICFTQCPDNGLKTYKTGDFVVEGSGGDLIYIGREDSQVKIRGFRIELNAIEHSLNAISGITQSIVKIEELNKEQTLFGYIETSSKQTLNTVNIKNSLSHTLPGYMIPNHFIFVDQFPLTPNGKIDRNALQHSKHQAPNKHKNRQTELTTHEIKLKKVWEGIFPNQNITIFDDFFELGGHSIMAAQLINQLKNEYRLDIPLSIIQSHSTISTLGLYIETQIDQPRLETSTPEDNKTPPPPKAQGPNYPLSFEQQDMYASGQKHPNYHVRHHIIIAQKLSGPLKVKAFEKAFNLLIKRHTMLRTIISKNTSPITQKALPYEPFSLKVTPLRSAEIQSTLHTLAYLPIDIENDNPFHLRMFKTDPDQYLFFLAVHHLFIDGWSLNILNQELSIIYGNIVNERSIQISTQKECHYEDYVRSQAQAFQHSHSKSLRQFWSTHLENASGFLFPRDYYPHDKATFTSENIYFALPETLTLKVKNLATSEKTSIFSIFMSALGTLLRQYTQEHHFLIWTPVFNRTQKFLQSEVGLFAHLMPVSIHFEDHLSIKSLLNKTQYAILNCIEHQAFPTHELMKLLQIKNPEFSSYTKFIFAYQNANEKFTLSLDDIQSETLSIKPPYSEYDLCLDLREIGNTYEGCLSYHSALYAKDSMKKMIDHFLRFVRELCESDKIVGALSCFSEQDLMLYSSKNTHPPLPSQTAIEVFADQVKLYPHHTAICYQNSKMSYEQLDRKSTILAHTIRSQHLLSCHKELGRDQFIGICIPRGPEMIIAILAVLKAGAAYVPFEPDIPTSRMAHILKDSSTLSVISTSQFRTTIEKMVPNVICLDSIDWETKINSSLPNINPENYAYMIYTSGTTGKPKGVVVTHFNLTRLFSTTQPLFNFSSQDVWTLFHSYAFDFSIWEIFGALFHGSRLVIVPSLITKDTHAFRELLKKESVSILNQTPTAFYQLCHVDTTFEDQLSLRIVIFGGEQLNLSLLTPWWKKYHTLPQLINMYGITETTVHVTFKQLSPCDASVAHNNIGKPLPDLNAYIINSHGALCPIGIPGELYISGNGLTKGYWNQEELTEKTFLEGSIFGLPEKKLYKTGDMAKWLESQEICYLGRQDTQVKIRGFRIQLEEIEAQLAQLKNIRASHALYHPQYKAIIIYLVTNQTISNSEALMHSLSDRLPSYMLPKGYVVLDTIPMNANGKVDERSLLQKPIQEFRASVFKAPKNRAEKILATCLEKTLGVLNISLLDNYFNLGGDSILILNLIDELSKHGYHIKAASIFEKPRILDIAKNLKKAKKKKSLSVEPFSLMPENFISEYKRIYTNAYPLTNLQQGMIFHSEYSKQSSLYIDVISCDIKGELNKIKLHSILTEMAQKHTILRTVIFQIDGQYWQGITENLDIPIRISSNNKAGKNKAFINEILKNDRKTFKAQPGSLLWKIEINVYNDNEFNLALICHHAILDGWSVALFFKVLLTNYDRAIENQPISILSPPLNYSDFVAHELNLVSDRFILEFWKDQIQHQNPCFVGKSLFIEEHDTAPHIITQSIVLEPALQTQLRKTASLLNIGLDMILFATHLYALSISLGREEVSTGLTAHDRFEHNQGSQMLGLFLNTLPFSCHFNSMLTWRDWIQKIIKIKAHLQNHKGYPLNEMLQKLNKSIFFDTLFNFVNFHVFDELKNLKNFEVSPSSCYADTNFSLVTQCSINPISKQCDIILIYDKNRVKEGYIHIFEEFFTEGLKRLSHNIDNSLIHDEALSHLNTYFPPMEWNSFTKTVTKSQNIFKLFLEAARKNPDKIALIEEDISISYQDLMLKVGHLQNIIQRKIPSEISPLDNTPTFIAIFMSRGINAVIAAISIVSLGYSYVPMDPDHPPKKIKYYIEDSHPKILFLDKKTLDRHSWIQEDYSKITVAYDHHKTPAGPDHSIIDFTQDANPLPAYMMYTSGSTGNPKGVLVGHSGIMRLVKEPNYIHISTKDNIAHTSNFSFDVSTFEIWGALSNGATLTIIPKETLLNPKQLKNTIKNTNITIMWLTARLFDALILMKEESLFSSLNTLMVGGDTLNKITIEKLISDLDGCPRVLLNGYGPTENTVFTTTHTITKNSLRHESIPIGKPISNTQVYILDEKHHILPIGETGELYVAGDGLAKGYHNSASKTSEKFFTRQLFDPINRTSFSVDLYNTGDRAKWLPNGDLEFLGRSDRTVKVNGYRVNLDDVEHLICKYTQIETCRTLLCADPTQMLVCFCVASNHEPPEAMRLLLKKHLSNHMIPNIFIYIPALPLTKNAKVNDDELRRLFLKTHTHTSKSSTQSSVSQKIRNIWIELLRHDQFSNDDTFFNVGGSSIMAMQLQQKLSQQFSQKIEIVDVFRYPSVKMLAHFLGKKPSSTHLHAPVKTHHNKNFKLRLKRVKTVVNKKEE